MAALRLACRSPAPSLWGMANETDPSWRCDWGTLLGSGAVAYCPIMFLPLIDWAALVESFVLCVPQLYLL